MEQTNILIVEDEHVVALDLQASLEGLGYAVSARVATGEAAIEKAGALHPDLVLMDIQLAGKLDGIEAAEQIRARFDRPVIYLTAFSDETTLQRARVSEPFGYILKPFERQTLHSNIEMALYKHRLELRLREAYAELEQRVAARTAELGQANAELQVEVAERRQAEVTLRESEERYRRLVETSPDAILLTDLEGRLIMANSQAASLFGYAGPAAMVGLKAVELYAPGDQAHRFDSLEMLVETDSVRRVEYVYRRKDGSSFWGEASASLLREALGSPRAVISVVHDITARRQAQEDLHRAKEAAEAANRAKTAFLAIMGHELRTPLNGIFMAAEMLREHGPAAVGKLDLPEVILTSGRRLLRMVEGVLEYTTVDAQLCPAPLAVEVALREVAARFEARAAHKGLALAWVISPELPAISFDLHQFDQVIWRLLDNALKFTPVGGRVTVTAEPVANWTFPYGELPAVRIRVADTGIGLKGEDCGRIFEPFVQVDAPYLLHSEGAGLGLTLARRQVELHGGHLWAESEGPGKGSTFTVVVPAQCAPEVSSLA